MKIKTSIVLALAGLLLITSCNNRKLVEGEQAIYYRTMDTTQLLNDFFPIGNDSTEFIVNTDSIYFRHTLGFDTFLHTVLNGKVFTTDVSYNLTPFVNMTGQPLPKEEVMDKFSEKVIDLSTPEGKAEACNRLLFISMYMKSPHNNANYEFVCIGWFKFPNGAIRKLIAFEEHSNAIEKASWFFDTDAAEWPAGDNLTPSSLILNKFFTK